jgi:hypothetical protein
MSFVAASASTGPGQPKFQVPKPPDYAACIAYLKRYPSFGSNVEPAKPTHAQLKANCDYEFRKERLKALYVLIAFDWVSGEAAELGVKVTPRELGKTIAAFEHAVLPGGETFKEYLASQRQTVGDLRMELEQELLVLAVHRKLEARAAARSLSTAQRQQALNEFAREYERKWRARTDCAPGYVVPICRQYTPPRTPSRLVPNSVPLTDLAAE